MDTIVTKEIPYKGQNLTICDKFQQIFAPIAGPERELLEKSLLQDGCRDAVIVWDNGSFMPMILDGHNRYEICNLHDIPFRLKFVKFTGANDEMQARAWILQNQLGRRNLPEQLKAKWWLRYQDLAEKLEAREGSSRKNLRNQESEEESKPQGRLNEAMARDIGVSASTAQKAIYIHKNATGETKDKWEKGETKIKPLYEELKVMEEGDENLKDQLKSGEMSPNKAYEIMQARKAEQKKTSTKYEYNDNISKEVDKTLESSTSTTSRETANPSESLHVEKSAENDQKQQVEEQAEKTEAASAGQPGMQAADTQSEAAVIRPKEFQPKGLVEKFQDLINEALEMVANNNIPNIVVIEAARKLRNATALKVITKTQ